MKLTSKDIGITLNSEIAPEHRIALDYMMFLYSDVVEKLKSARELDAFGFFVDLSDFNESEHQKLRTTPDPIGFLRSKGKEPEVRKSIEISVAPALIAEFCSTWYEVLSLIPRGKTSIAFQLLRKQLEDTLFHIEWMAGDLDSYVDVFNAGTPADLSRTKAFPDPGARIALIQKAIDKADELNIVAGIAGAELLQIMRYDRSAVSGYYKLGQQAIHLITAKYSELATEPYELNFVFSGPDAIESQQSFLCSTLPYICDHFWSLANVLLDNVVSFDREHSTWLLDQARRVAGLELIRSSEGVTDLAEQFISETIQRNSKSCMNCEWNPENFASASREELHKFMFDGTIKCGRCESSYFVY